MQFFDERPSGYTGHNTGGEHLLKHYYDPEEINAIRLKVNSGVDSWDCDEVREVMASHFMKGELINTFHDANGEYKMIGGILVRYTYPNKGTVKRVVLDASDIVVLEEHRQNTVGTFLLSKALISVPYDGGTIPYASELVITDRNKIVKPKTSEALAKAGFNRKDENNNPKMLLAGRRTGGFVSIVDKEVYDDMSARMPGSWDGFISVGDDFYGKPRGFHAYRRGQYLGCVQTVENSFNFDKHDRDFERYNYFSADGVLIDEAVPQPTEPFFAVSDLVNRLAED